MSKLSAEMQCLVADYCSEIWGKGSFGVLHSHVSLRKQVSMVASMSQR